MSARRLAGTALSVAVIVLVTACGSRLQRHTTAPARDPHPPSTAIPAASGSVWPSAMHDAMHTGTSSATGPTTGHIRWTRDLGANVTPGPVVAADGTIYSATNAGVLHALDPATGADRWTYDGGGAYGGDLSTSPAVLADGTILWPGPRSRLFALTPTGTLRWSEEFDAQVLSPAVAGDGVVYVMTMAGSLTRLDVTSSGAKRRWTISVGSSSYGSPAVGPDGTIATSVDNEVVTVFDQGDRAAVKWRYDTGFLIEVSPAVASDGTIVIGTNGHTEIALNADGTERWQYQRDAQSYSSAAITPDGVAWFGDHRGYVNGVRISDGHLVRRVRGLGFRPGHSSSIGVWTSPVVDRQSNVYFGTRPGHIYGFAGDGRRLFDIDTHSTVDSYPALTADGTLVIGATNGLLYAVHD